VHVCDVAVAGADADGAVAAAAIPADPAIMAAATNATSAGRTARDVSREMRVCRVWAPGWFWLIGLTSCGLFLVISLRGRDAVVSQLDDAVGVGLLTPASGPLRHRNRRTRHRGGARRDGAADGILVGLGIPGVNAPCEERLVKAGMAHLNLTMIHPFRDGNGRMARCLQSLVLAVTARSWRRSS
jgi:Fic/DOC family